MYKYEEMKDQLFTEQGNKMFAMVMQRVNSILSQYSCVMMQDAIKGCSGYLVNVGLY
jgi:hypothetical protein